MCVHIHSHQQLIWTKNTLLKTETHKETILRGSVVKAHTCHTLGQETERHFEMYKSILYHCHFHSTVYWGLFIVEERKQGQGQATLCSHTIGDCAVTGICRDEQLSTVLWGNVWGGKVLGGTWEDLAKKGKTKENKNGRIKNSNRECVCTHDSTSRMVADDYMKPKKVIE